MEATARQHASGCVAVRMSGGYGTESLREGGRRSTPCSRRQSHRPEERQQLLAECYIIT